MNLTLKVWRQNSSNSPGQFETYEAKNVLEDMSFLEMLDVINEDITRRGEEPVAFDHDCREGICGSCSCVINGEPHGPEYKVATCQTYMRSFRDGDTIVVEPFRARAFPILKDLVVDRSAFDRIMHAGGFMSVNTGAAPDANAIPVPKPVADLAMDAAACIGCGLIYLLLLLSEFYRRKYLKFQYSVRSICMDLIFQNIEAQLQFNGRSLMVKLKQD